MLQENFLPRVHETKPCICSGTPFRVCFLTDPNQKLSCTFVAEEEGALADDFALFLLRLLGPPTVGELMMSWRWGTAAVWRNVSSYGGITPIMWVKQRQQWGCCKTRAWTRENWTTTLMWPNSGKLINSPPACHWATAGDHQISNVALQRLRPRLREACIHTNMCTSGRTLFLTAPFSPYPHVLIFELNQKVQFPNSHVP